MTRITATGRAPCSGTLPWRARQREVLPSHQSPVESHEPSRSLEFGPEACLSLRDSRESDVPTNRFSTVCHAPDIAIYPYFSVFPPFPTLLARNFSRLRGLTFNQIDRFLHQTIHDHLVTPTLLPNLLRAVRARLFPGNTRPIPTPTLVHGQSQGTGVKALGGAPHLSVLQQVQQPPTPTPAEEGVPTNATSSGQSATSASLPSLSEIDPAAAKRRCAIRILSVVPRRVVRTLLGHLDAVDDPPDGSHNDDSSSISNTDREELFYVEAIESDLLDLFADEYCNKHLVYAIIELILVRLLPELGERSVAELMEDRGVGVGA